MDNKEIIYEEDYVNSRVLNDEHSIAYTKAAIREVYSEKDGWKIGEPQITPNPDNTTVTVKVHLTRYNVPEKTNSMRF